MTRGQGPVLHTAGLRKRFGDLQAVDDVGFDIAEGETYGLLGPNGAGKTTSISMIAGLLAADGGEVVVAGEPMTTTAVRAKAHLGLVPQDLAIYPDLTARENLRFFARLYDLDRGRLAARVDEVLELTGLSDRADDRSDEFSGGMKRRLNIGIGLLHEPRLLILDEPTVGVDPQSRNAILEAVEALSGGGMGVLYTTHYMEEAERLCDRIGIIDQGRLQAEGSRRELVALVGGHDTVALVVTGDAATVAPELERLDGVQSVAHGPGTLDLIVTDAGNLLTRLLDTVTRSGASVTGVSIVEPNLEAVFLHLTGKALRD